jgi:ornithine cyclodeaminase/alanine dehydrogenase-like protein (mu-crystallin family)
MSPAHIPFLDATDVEALLPMPALIAAVGRAFRDMHPTPSRVVLSDGGPNWLVMPCLGPDGDLVCKILRVDPTQSSGSTVPTIAGAVVLVAPDGRTEALIDAAALTARRTAAIAGFATDLLAPPDGHVLALFGTGALAASHVEAIHTVRPLSAVRVVGRSQERGLAFVERLRALGHDATLTTPASALLGAHIVVTVTTASDAVFADGSITPGMHINAMGSYLPSRREIPGETVARAAVVVEVRADAWQEAGDLLQPLADGLIGADHVVADLTEDGETIRRIRTDDPSAVTLFKSVGHAALDLAAVSLLRPALLPA